MTGVGVSPESLINAPRGVVGSVPRMDLACRLRRSWRSSRLLVMVWCQPIIALTTIVLEEISPASPAIRRGRGNGLCHTLDRVNAV
jgi:hypothetical protein